MTKKSLLFAACALSWMIAPASAQTQDRRTFYTFKAPVEIPGATLPPGKYVFRRANPDNASVIQVLSDADKKVWGMFFTVPTQRPNPADKSEVRFLESAPGTAQAVKTMWYIGESTGREFIYPREQAMRIAQLTKQPVLTTRTAAAVSDEPQSGELSRVSATGADMPVTETASADANAGVAMQGDPVPETYAVPAPPAPRQMASARTELPRTASEVPVVGLAGLCLLGLGVALHGLRRARA